MSFNNPIWGFLAAVALAALNKAWDYWIAREKTETTDRAQFRADLMEGMSTWKEEAEYWKGESDYWRKRAIEAEGQPENPNDA